MTRGDIKLSAIRMFAKDADKTAKFYEALGYAYVGGIPGFALDPGGSPAKNAIYYKTLP